MGGISHDALNKSKSDAEEDAWVDNSITPASPSPSRDHFQSDSKAAAALSLSHSEVGDRSNGITRLERARLSRRHLTTAEEGTSGIQPGRSRDSLARTLHLGRNKPSKYQHHVDLLVPRVTYFFRQIEVKFILTVVIMSSALTAAVMHGIKKGWHDELDASSAGISVLGAFISFGLVFRTQTCYSRWWEARTQWGIMVGTMSHIAGQGRSWFKDKELVDLFLSLCVLFPYACKAQLRGNSLMHSSEEGPDLVSSGLFTGPELDAIIAFGVPPFACLESMRNVMNVAFRHEKGSVIQENLRDGALLSLEDSLRTLNTTIGACLKIKSTRMPETYDIFMRCFIFFFFMLVSIAWVPSLGWFTPVLTGFIVFLLSMVIVIGNMMLHPFDVQWAGLPLQKFCVIIEKEVHSVSNRHRDLASITDMLMQHYDEQIDPNNSTMTIGSVEKQVPRMHKRRSEERGEVS